jgi:hypothetical protein
MKPGYYKYDDLIFEYEPFYVGKGKGNRFLYHLNKVKNNCKFKKSYKFDIIQEILYNGYEPIILKMKELLSEDDSLSLEKDTIVKIGRIDMKSGPLANRNDGGKKPQDNYHHSNESKIKISNGGKNRLPDNRYTLISPYDELYSNVKLGEFCKLHKLDYQKIRKSSNIGKILPIAEKYKKLSKLETLNCVGWEVINTKIIKLEKQRSIKYKIISPDNECYIIYNNQVAENIISKLGLDFRTLSIYRNKGKINIRNINQCKKQESKNCQGWEFLDFKRDERKKEFESIREVSYVVRSPIGEEYLVKNLSSFCTDNNLSIRTFRTFMKKEVEKVEMCVRKNYSIETLNTIGWSILPL